MTFPGPVTPHSDEVRAAAFTAARACARPEDIYKQMDTIIAAVRPLIEAGERTRIADAIDALYDASALDGHDFCAGIEAAARIARGDTT